MGTKKFFGKSVTPYRQKLLKWLFFGATSFLVMLPFKAINAAEKIYFDYGPLNLSIDVKSLEEFAQDGTVNSELEFYLNGVSEQNRQIFRDALQKSYKVDPLQVYHFFYSNIGEEILFRIGRIINIQGEINGKYAIRGALMSSAFSPEGLSLLNFLRFFPTNMELNTDNILIAVNSLETFRQGTELLVQSMGQLSAEEAATEGQVNFSTLPDIREPGPFEVHFEKVILEDKTRQRKFRNLIYRPKTLRQGKTPVVIFSHGLGSRPEDYSQYGKHLASYGYYVALPQHPGSDTSQIEALFEGYSSEVFDVQEFIDRPKDISFILDELEKQNQSKFNGRLDLDNVGVMGHSFGGYTAIALAGATFNFDRLERDCTDIFDPRNVINLSLLLQCQVLELPRENYNFRDPRVKAIFPINPVNSSIFGPVGIGKIKIPVYLVASSKDPAAPAVLEQLRTFIWLENDYQYLALEKGNTHVDFTKLDPGITQLINSIDFIAFPDQNLIDDYVSSMSLAFFETRLLNNNTYEPYLSSSYAQYISQSPFDLYLISDKSLTELYKIMNNFREENGLEDEEAQVSLPKITEVRSQESGDKN